MLKITKLLTEHLAQNCVTDATQPRFSFSLESDRENVTLKKAVFTVGDWSLETTEQNNVKYAGKALKPFTSYLVTVTATDDAGETATASMPFETGRLAEPWKAQWITDPTFTFTDKGISPVPMVFKKTIQSAKPVKSAKIYATAMGVFELDWNGKKVGKDYFAPGFTSYAHELQYLTYDVTEDWKADNTLVATVAGGWAVGSFVFTRKNRIYADRQALLLELRVTYQDGTEEVVATDSSWQVTEESGYRMADIYDGETFDATVNLDKLAWKNAGVETLRIHPSIYANIGAMVCRHEVMKPISVKKAESGELLYDFGQNFAGVISFKIKNAKKGQTVVFRHAEILKRTGELFTELLRSAKQTMTYTCVEGDQEYSPRLTYMGFRYVGVTGIAEEDLELTAYALYSDMERIGDFSCSNELINRLQSNIMWSAKSNFMDIPTDCPQRDERMGWTGDISVFSPTACFNYDMSRFLEKWLVDVKAEQLKSGGIPNTVPVHGYGFPATMPTMAVDFWGDACITVPWAEYQARGDKELLEKMYPTMKKYVKACKFWANLFSFGKKKYIWSGISMLHFGDWIAPDVEKMSEWQARHKWTATASLCHTSGMLAEIAKILGKPEDEAYYADLSKKVADAYESVLTDGKGKLLNEFQTAYVLPLHFKMFSPENQKAAADNLANLVKRSNYCIATGFPGTPYILFSLADNGHAEEAFKMLTNTECPSWLYEVKAGGTTVWERWDALRPDGTGNLGQEDGTGGMISYNHYASGAVGDFLYRRIAGIEATSPAFKTVQIKPLVGGGITSAKGAVNTPYGKVSSDWKVTKGKFTIAVEVPVNTTAEVVLPSGASKTCGSGKYEFTEKI